MRTYTDTNARKCVIDICAVTLLNGFSTLPSIYLSLRLVLFDVDFYRRYQSLFHSSLLSFFFLFENIHLSLPQEKKCKLYIERSIKLQHRLCLVSDNIIPLHIIIQWAKTFKFDSSRHSSPYCNFDRQYRKRFYPTENKNKLRNTNWENCICITIEATRRLRRERNILTKQNRTLSEK